MKLKKTGLNQFCFFLFLHQHLSTQKSRQLDGLLKKQFNSQLCLSLSATISGCHTYMSNRSSISKGNWIIQKQNFIWILTLFLFQISGLGIHEVISVTVRNFTLEGWYPILHFLFWLRSHTQEAIIFLRANIYLFIRSL